MNLFTLLTKNKYNGGVALIVVIALSLITLLGGVALSIASIDYKLATVGYTFSIDLKHLEFSCQEEALKRISTDVDFVGTKQVDIDSSSCSYTVSDDLTDPDLSVVNIAVTKGDYTSQSSFKVNTTTNPISIIR